MKTLTPRQRQVLDFITDHICEHGFAPSIREICTAMEIKSTNGVSEHIETLCRKGYLVRDAQRNLARAIRPKHLPTGNRGTLEIPVVGEVTAGAPRLAVEESEERLCVDRSLLGEERDVFALRIAGESMIERGIHHGDLVFVRQTRDAQDGDVVIALIDDEATCKLFYREPNRRRIRLQPANATMEPIYVAKDAFRETMILGVVIGLYRAL
jgi:repressor LexA